MKKKKVVTVLIVAAALVAAVVVVLVIRRRKNNPKESIAESIAGAIGGYVAESFPLKKGMKGNNVKRMQNAINFMSNLEKSEGRDFISLLTADGLFGANTLKAVRWYYDSPSKNEVSEYDFNGLMNLSAMKGFKNG
jgi:hypothetical protein